MLCKGCNRPFPENDPVWVHQLDGSVMCVDCSVIGAERKEVVEVRYNVWLARPGVTELMARDLTKDEAEKRLQAVANVAAALVGDIFPGMWKAFMEPMTSRQQVLMQNTLEVE